MAKCAGDESAVKTFQHSARLVGMLSFCLSLVLSHNLSVSLSRHEALSKDCSFFYKWVVKHRAKQDLCFPNRLFVSLSFARSLMCVLCLLCTCLSFSEMLNRVLFAFGSKCVNATCVNTTFKNPWLSSIYKLGMHRWSPSLMPPVRRFAPPFSFVCSQNSVKNVHYAKLSSALNVFFFFVTSHFFLCAHGALPDYFH